MLILSNSLAQFIVNASIGVLTVLAAVIIPIVIYKRQKNRKKIVYQVISDTSIVSVGEHISKVEVLFNGKSVEDVHLVLLKLLNSGNIAVRPSDFENDSPIRFDFGKEAEVLDAKVLETKPKSMKQRVNMQFNANYLEMHPLLLNKDDSILLKILVENFVDEITVEASIADIEEISRKWEQNVLSERAVFSWYIFCLMWILCCAIITISVYLLSDLFFFLSLNRYYISSYHLWSISQLALRLLPWIIIIEAGLTVLLLITKNFGINILYKIGFIKLMSRLIPIN